MTTKAIHYDAAAIARLVSFALLSSQPRIQRETRETLQTLRAVAAGKKQVTPAILNYFQLAQKGARFVCV